MRKACTCAALIIAALLALAASAAGHEPVETQARGAAQRPPHSPPTTRELPPTRLISPAPARLIAPAPVPAQPPAPLPSPALRRSVDSSLVRAPAAPGRSPDLSRDPSGSELPAPVGPLRITDPLSPPVAPQHPLAPQAGSPEASAQVRVTIRAIAARRSGETLEIDGRLRPIDRDLRSFAEQFNYKLYQLLDEQTVELDFRRPTQLELPGQRSLEVQATGLFQDGRLRLHLELLGPHPSHERKLHTDYSLPRGRTILVGGYRVDPDRPESGTLLLAITQVE